MSFLVLQIFPEPNIIEISRFRTRIKFSIGCVHNSETITFSVLFNYSSIIISSKESLSAQKKSPEIWMWHIYYKFLLSNYTFGALNLSFQMFRAFIKDVDSFLLHFSLYVIILILDAQYRHCA